MSERIHQEIVVDAVPSRVYAALTDAKAFQAMTGAPTEIAAEAGGAFSCFGGMIHGRNIELVKNERVVQAWRPKPWEAGVYSIVRFEIQAEGKKTKITLDHTGFPEGQGVHLDKGWHSNYWEPLVKYLAQ